jgi:hypothetical protein
MIPSFSAGKITKKLLTLIKFDGNLLLKARGQSRYL